jgi:hypothetical protein
MEISESVRQRAREYFSEEEIPGVLLLLAEYGTRTHHREVDRVRHAIIKASRGSVEDLESLLASADTDYRDVLWWTGEA